MRSRNRRRRGIAGVRFAALAVVLVALGGLECASAAAKISASARVGAGYDSNVFEFVSAGRRVSDGYSLLEMGLALEPGERGPLARLRWGIERYSTESVETRHVLWSELGWRWGNRDRWFSLTWDGAQRSFPTDEVRDVTRHELRASARLRGFGSGRVLCQAAGALARTSPRGPSERRGWLGSAEYWHRLRAPWQVFGRIEGGATRYERRIEGECPQGHPVGPFDSQEDAAFLIGSGVALSGAPLLRLFYGLRLIDSNVESFSLRRHELRLQAGWIMPAGFSMQLLANWNSTQYRQRGCPANLPTEDTEDPELWERNSIILQLRRPLSAGFSGELRGEWQRNEALTLGRFYEKTTIEASITCGAAAAD